jgi:hypothetical protein
MLLSLSASIRLQIIVQFNFWQTSDAGGSLTGVISYV